VQPTLMCLCLKTSTFASISGSALQRARQPFGHTAMIVPSPPDSLVLRSYTCHNGDLPQNSLPNGLTIHISHIQQSCMTLGSNEHPEIRQPPLDIYFKKVLEVANEMSVHNNSLELKMKTESLCKSVPETCRRTLAS
jgi:hypothetical protein